MEFSKDFLWGAATSAPQVEGAYLEGGRRRSKTAATAMTPATATTGTKKMSPS